MEGRKKLRERRLADTCELTNKKKHEREMEKIRI